MIKEIKYNGYTATPSDYESPDGDLVGIMNAVPEDGEVKPILPPTELCTLPTNTRLLFLHATQPTKHYILHNKTSGRLSWFNVDDDPSVAANVHEIDSHQFNTIYDINAIGNTLVALGDGGPFYMLWKNSTSSYVALGEHLPEVELAFSLYGARTADRFDVDCSYRSNQFSSDNPQEFYQYDDRDKETISNAILGNINKHIAEHHENGRFVMPFLVRYAYRLYDGTLTMHSAPQLMIPNTSTPWACLSNASDVNKIDSVTYIAEKFEVTVNMMSFNLNCTNVEEDGIGDWSDIVKSVDVFVSAPIYAYDQSGSCEGFTQDSPGGFFVGGYLQHATPNVDHGINKYNNIDNNVFGPSATGWYVSVPKREDSAVIKDIQECANFYLMQSYAVDSDGIDMSPSEEISKDLRALVTREVMTDDYDSHDLLKPQKEFIYNGRLNIAAITKQHFNGFTAAQMVPKAEVQTATKAFVKLNVEGMEGVLVAGKASPWTSSAGTTIGAPLYLYYPNTNARQITLTYSNNGTTMVHTFDLKKHDFLNGSFYFEGWEAPTYEEGAEPTASTNNKFETDAKNKIYTSEVNNPFYFPVTGINTVGTGEIMAICSATKALSQGQFGQFPLYAFTSEGVWALETSSTGTFTARQPVTRDVCTNAESITQLDDSVLFATDRGIMLLSGSNTLCITDEINNTTPIDLDLPAAVATLSGISMPTIAKFTDYLKGARMTYDYTGQRIIVFNPTATAYSYAYVYSLKDKKWGMMESTLSYPINSYPEALAVTKGNKLVNLSQDVNSNESASDDVQTVNVLLATRPLKLDQGDVLKTVNTVIQRGKFDYLQSGRTPKPVRSLLMGSRDLYNWHMIWSSADHYLRGFSGTPYKYFRIVVLGSLAPDESLFGCTVNYVPKLINQVR